MNMIFCIVVVNINNIIMILLILNISKYLDHLVALLKNEQLVYLHVKGMVHLAV